MKTAPLCVAFVVGLVSFAVDARPQMTKVQADIETVIVPATQSELEELIRSADAGDSAAQMRLGNLYFFSVGDFKNYALAIQRYRQAAITGLPEAQFTMGNVYDFGHGVDPDDAQAFEWYLKAAEQGHPRAQYSVGVFFNEGRGVARDDIAAVSWFEKAAAVGYVRAQFNLGNIYSNGRGVDNISRAMQFYRLAAKGGYTEAQVNLANAYAQGKVVRPNLKYAYKWYSIAATSEGPLQSYGQQGLRYLNNKLSSAAKRAATAAAEKCVRDGLSQCE